MHLHSPDNLADLRENQAKGSANFFVMLTILNGSNIEFSCPAASAQHRIELPGCIRSSRRPPRGQLQRFVGRRPISAKQLVDELLLEFFGLFNIHMMTRLFKPDDFLVGSMQTFEVFKYRCTGRHVVIPA